jgi:DNA modification methylase
LEKTPEAYISKLVEVFTEVYRILKPTGTLWLNIGDLYWGGKSTIQSTGRKREYIKTKDLIGIPWMLAFELRRAGFYLRQDIIWHKPNPMPESVKDRCTKSHEYIFLLTKSANYYFDHESILEPAAYDGRKDMAFKGSNKYAKGLSPSHHGSSIPTYPVRNKRDVWSVCTKAEKESHFAVFPETLIVDCIKAGCPEDGIVLDPFIGSGTTAVVARKLNRNYIGFELNPKYIEISNRKIYNETGMFK